MIKQSELILNKDGSVFHLHLKPEHISTRVILVGDPARVDTISSFFDRVEFSVQNREFKTITGWYKGTKLTTLSTGIGTDNIDIVLNELDALVNIDLEKREVKKDHTKLELIRIGTSGAVQSDLGVNSLLVSEKSIGFDGLLNFYADRHSYCDTEFEEAFVQFTGWSSSLPAPYVVDASTYLFSKFRNKIFTPGVTISAPGFYGPQGRVLRLPLADPVLNKKIEDFRFNAYKITNFEMESSAIYGLSKMLGHEALTICMIIANRINLKANENYREEMNRMVKVVLDRLIQT